MLFSLLLSAFAEEPVYTPQLHVAVRPQVWTNPDYNAGTQDGIWSMKQLVRFGFTAETKALRLHTKLQDYRMWGQEASPFLNRDVLQTMHEGYVQIAFTPNTWLRLGRQEYRLLDGRLLWAAPWTLLDRSYDAARLYSKGEKWAYNLIGGVSRSAQNYQTICDDAVADCTDFQPEIIKSNGDLFLSTDIALRFSDALRWSPYFVAIYQDASAEALDQKRRVYTAGMHAKGVVNEALIYTVEGAYQFGQESVDVEHSAWMAAAELGYQQSGRKVSFFYEELSGDGDPTDTVQNDFEGFQGSRHIYRGLSDAIGTKNIRDYGLKSRISFWDKYAALLEVHHFELSNPEGYWYAVSNKAVGGGEKGNQDGVLGNELDLRIDYRPTKAMNLRFTQGIFLPAGYGAEITEGDLSMTSYIWMRYTL